VTYIDISVDISNQLPVWPGSPEIMFSRSSSIDDGDVANDTTIHFSVHTGTHIDAPSHFLPHGKTVDQIPLELLVGKTYIVEVSANVSDITPNVLESLSIPQGIKRLLLKTRNSQFWQSNVKEFQTDFAALTLDAAQWVVERGIQLIGIDYLSIQRFYDGPETHQILLSSEIVIIEGLDLNGVSSGYYDLICLPLKLRGLEGSPARVILRPYVS
jgi:arylformamidase